MVTCHKGSRAVQTEKRNPRPLNRKVKRNGARIFQTQSNIILFSQGLDMGRHKILVIDP